MGIIYLMTNKINGLQYIGQTSTTLATRMIGHKHEAKVLKPDVYFVRAMHKYGFENFEVQVIEECADELLNEREIYWISEYDTFLGPGYNSTRGGNGNKKFLNSDILELWNTGYTRFEIADKLNCHVTTVSNSLHASGITPEEIRSRAQSLVCKKKEILQYDLSGNLLAIYSSADEAARVLKCSPGGIRQVCNHHLTTNLGYIWCHVDEPKSIQQLIAEIPLSKRNKIVNQYDLKGNLIKTYKSCAEAARQLGVTGESIEDAARGNSLSCLKTLWQYEDDFSDIQIKVNAFKHQKDYHKRKVNQYDLQGNFIMIHDSAKEASQYIGKNNGASSITKVCRGKLKTAYGFKWSYAEA